MANWDHLSNIGTHPVLDPDPTVSLIAKIEAAAYQAARHDKIEKHLRDAARDAGVDFFAVRAAVSRGRQRAIEQDREREGV